MTDSDVYLPWASSTESCETSYLSSKEEMEVASTENRVVIWFKLIFKRVFNREKLAFPNAKLMKLTPIRDTDKSL